VHRLPIDARPGIARRERGIGLGEPLIELTDQRLDVDLPLLPSRPARSVSGAVYARDLD
jgi:hypothetical protein